jgi:predicted neutral ceramidase superfamily lipid hydrolase
MGIVVLREDEDRRSHPQTANRTRYKQPQILMEDVTRPAVDRWKIRISTFLSMVSKDLFWAVLFMFACCIRHAQKSLSYLIAFILYPLSLQHFIVYFRYSTNMEGLSPVLGIS